MLILEGFKCDAALQRGLLWHSWLKNQILQMDGGYVVRMHRRPTLREEKAAFELKIQPGGVFETNLHSARLFASRIVEGFSPGQLVDTETFTILSAETRDIIKTVIHREYVNQTHIDLLVEPVERAIDDLEISFTEFTEAWYRQPVAEEKMVQETFEKLKERAKILHELLGRLPEGVVLP